MRGFANQLTAVGKNINDEDLILMILDGFGIEFEVVATVVNLTNRIDTLNLQELQYALQAHEIRIQNQSSFAFSSENVAYNQSTNCGQSEGNYGNHGGRFSNFRGRGGGSSYGGRSGYG